jgi:diguanylate cyclase (GGDEF)-like protein
MGLIADGERAEVREVVERALTTADGLEFECHLVRPDGTARLVQGVGRRVEDDGGGFRLVGTIQDVTERRQALHDPLTGLPNRTLFLDRVEHARTQQQRDSTTLALLFVDLDNFKTVNDTKGHIIGGTLLREVGTRIGGVLRPGDTLARLGGDEFVILLNGVDGAGDVTVVADRVLEAIAPARLAEEIGVAAGASIGIVVEPPPGSRSAVELLRDADVAMYAAKRTSKGSWVLFDPTMGRDVQWLHSLTGDLRRAVYDEELFLQYQPIVRLSDGSLEGVEALVRWRHPQRGVVPPLEFIPVAEESGQIAELGQWILERACTDAARWRDPSSNGPLALSVNVAPGQLREARFVERLVEALSLSGLPPERLILDVAESSLAGGASIERRLDEIADLGVRLAVDDFGSGSSSLGGLHRLPIERLKIDRPFIDHLSDDTVVSAVPRAVVELGRALTLDVVAEGVEREDQAEMLRRIGCGLAQGYLFSRPVDAHEIDAVLGGEPASTEAGRVTA